MNQNEQTQTDLLLRRFARRDAETARVNDVGNSSRVEKATRELTSVSGAHLDADEMNAYAENALPAPTRTRFMAHLADCETCRRSVTSLTLATGIASESKQPAARIESAPARSWRDWLGLIFAPPVVRYGVPALALCFIITAALIATRTRNTDEFVAQNQTAQTSAPASPSGDQSSSANEQNAENAHGAEGATESKLENAPPPPPLAANQSATSTARTPTAEIAPTNPTSSATIAADAPAPKVNDDAPAAASAPAPLERETRDEDLRAARSAPAQTSSQPSAAPSDKAAAKGDVEDVVKEKKREEVAGNRGEASGVPVTRSVDGSDDREEQAALSRTASSGAGANAPAKPARRPVATSRSREVAKVASESGTSNSIETRNAGGHRFRRQGGAWIDTAYNSARATINVARGSEQFRALVADEPGLGSIANQLDGEVIIVWKGRAYRIH
jgi:hypothetical protein